MANESRDLIYITLGNSTFSLPKPNGFEIEREDIYSAEYTSMSGKTIADRIGWKYADFELKWDALKQTDVSILIGINGSFTLGFHDETNTFVEEDCIKISSVMLPYRYQQSGVYWWKEPSVKVRFLNAHNS